MESKDQIDVVEERECYALSTATATLECDDVTSRGKILLNNINKTINGFAIVAYFNAQSLFVNAGFKVCRSACSLVFSGSLESLRRRRPRGHRLVKMNLYFTFEFLNRPFSKMAAENLMHTPSHTNVCKFFNFRLTFSQLIFHLKC